MFRTIKRDSGAEKRLQKNGWKVLTVWGCETKDRSALADRICRFLGRSGAVAETCIEALTA